jgi:dipeptidyl aminopeptidase/acylaminoacyl peptidase
MTQARALPCGSWPSPVSPDALAQAALRLGSPALGDDGSVYWVEGRPAEGGRNALVRRWASGRVEDAVPPPFNVRSRVHEYGGGAYAVWGEDVYFVDFSDQRLWHSPAGGVPRLLGGGDGWRLGDLVVDRRRRRLLAVGERAVAPDAEPENAIVALGLEDGRLEVLVRGADFYASPAPSPDGGRLAFLSWNHPHMPWDAAALYVAPLDEQGRAGPARHVAGGAGASTLQPAWSPDGALVFLFEPEGYWNLHQEVDGAVRAICPMPAELGLPLWQLGGSTWGFADARTIVAAAVEQGLARVVAVDLPTGRARPVPMTATALSHLACRHGRTVVLAGWPDRATAVALLDATTGHREVLREASPIALDPATISSPEGISFATTDGDTAFGFFYSPRNPQCVPLPGERPPLIVIAHGGPTGATTPTFSWGVQFWTTRGFAVLDVNYRGSTGYGRRYRDRLRGMWGVYDVDDCVAGARALAQAGRVDGRRVAIRGSSAGGYTVLAALTFRDVFQAGASLYGVSDLEALARETHKFEARYLDQLVGPYPERRDLYVARSPIHAADRLSCPVIFFQGLEDKIVPPGQAETMVAALRAKGIAVEYHVFEGEQHGFRRAETIRRVYQAELAFYGRSFGFTPAP